MALGLAVRAFAQVAGRLWNKPLTVGSSLVMAGAGAAVPVGVAVVDHETDGGLSEAAYKTTISYLKEKVKEGASPESIERTMDALSYVSAISNRLDKFAQNTAVLEIMGHNEGADTIKKGKAAAIAYQFVTPNNLGALVAKQSIRQAFADDLFKGDKNAADKYLAKSLIDDIVKNAQVHALKDNQVSHDDVKKTITDIINNPDKHPVASKFFSERGRLMNGLKQMWPELSPAQRPAAETPTGTPTPSARTEDGQNGSRPRSRLGEAFDMAADGEGTVMKMMLLFMAALLQMMGLGKDQAAKPDENRPADRPVAGLTPRPGM